MKQKLFQQIVAGSDLSWSQFSNIYQLLEDCPGTSFMLAVDDENPNDARSASIEIGQQLLLSSGLIVLGKKKGRISYAFNEIYFKQLVLFFPSQEDFFAVHQKNKENHEEFLRMIEERIVYMLESDFRIHVGKGRALFLSHVV